MADEELVTSNPPPAGAPADAPDETVEPAVADDYTDAERDEVAARLASLGYIDE